MPKQEKISKSLSLKFASLIKKAEKAEGAIKGIKKIIIVRLNNIGDALITTSLIGELKKSEDVTIDVICSERNKMVFENRELCDKVYIYDKKINTFLKIIKEINSEKYDCIIDSHDDVSSTASMFIAFSNCKYKAALEKSNTKLFTHTVKRLDATLKHPVERVLEIAKIFGINPDFEKINILFNLSKDNIANAKDFLHDNFNNDKLTIGINLFAGSNARFWGIENYKMLINYLKEKNYNIYLIAPESKLDETKKISGIVPVFSGNLNSVAAIISLSGLLITPDTSLVHIASAFKTPVFGLFVHYNTNEVIWSPYKSKFDCVITKEPTLKNVRIENVIQKLSEFILKIGS